MARREHFGIVAACLVLACGTAVAGKIEVTGFTMPTGAANGYVLTSDASGVGTWRSAGQAHFGETWTGSATVGLKVVNTRNVDGSACLFGESTAGTGAVDGVRGQSGSTAGVGVAGYATASSGETYGIYGESESASGRGVFGYALASSGETYGVYGEANSVAATGVYGFATASSGETSGVCGESNSSDGIGVYGFAGASTGQAYGVYGESGSSQGMGVFGHASASSGSAVGVYGMCVSNAGYAGFFTGGYGLHVDGDLSCTGAKPFVQPHPNDPTKEIVYVALEGPEAGTYVRGSAELRNGEARVALPEHFSLVTRPEGLTVQLTPDGQWLQLYVAEKSPRGLVVREASGKSGRFDYLVQGVRIGYESHQVVRDRRPAPVLAAPARTSPSRRALAPSGGAGLPQETTQRRDGETRPSRRVPSGDPLLSE